MDGMTFILYVICILNSIVWEEKKRKMKLYKNVELSKSDAEQLKVFLKNNKIKFEISGADNLVHFEILVNQFEEKKINEFLETLG